MRKNVIAVSVLMLMFLFFGSVLFAGGKKESISPGFEKGAKDQPSSETETEHSGSPQDHFPEKVSVEYAEGFTVEYFSNYKVVRVIKPWQGAFEDFEYLLVQRGTDTPEGYEHAQIIEIPIKKIVTMSTTYVTYLDMLDELDSLVGHECFLYTMNDKVLDMAAQGKIKETGSGPQVNVELILELEPDVIMTHAVGGEWDTHPKLFEADLTVAMNGEYMEGSPLGRFEWIKFVSLFYNKEAAAELLFREAADAYNDLAAKAAAVVDKPTVLVNSPYQGTWWIAGGKSFQARFIKDAGGEYMWADDNSYGAIMLDIEAVFERAFDADVWINPGMWSSLAEAEAEDERFAEFTAFQEGGIFNNNKMKNENGGNAYWEFGLAQPHIVLADMMKIFHPELMQDHEFVYYHRLK